MKQAQRKAFYKALDDLGALSAEEKAKKLQNTPDTGLGRQMVEGQHFIPFHQAAVMSHTNAWQAVWADLKRAEGKVGLQRLSQQHVSDLLRNWGSDPATFSHLTSAPVDTQGKITDLCVNSEAAYQTGQLIRFAILYYGVAVGIVTLTHHDSHPGQIEIGMSLGSAFCKKQIGSSVLQQVLAHLGAKDHPARLFSTVRPGSPGRPLLMKNGFISQEHVTRASIYGPLCRDPHVLCELFLSP